MNNYNPISISFQLEGVKRSVVSFLDTHDNEMQKMIADAIEETLNEDWVLNEINIAVKQCIEKAIASMSDNITMQSLIRDLIIEEVGRKFNEAK
jgi:hypothetical protein